MGVVYRATEPGLKRPVALKLLAPELMADERFRARFQHESEIAASIGHPHVVPVLRAGEEDGLLFIAMRFIEGQDLAKVIAAEGPLEPLRAARIVDQVAGALDCAHEHGLVHRDVKPSNVLVERRGRGEHAYLTDFGLTKHTTSIGGMTKTGAVVGTIDYMAPEQLRGEPLDARTDVYSLGCLLFEALTGRVPYPRDRPEAVMFAHLSAPPPRPSELRRELPPTFDGLIARALAKSPDNRHPSAGDLGFAALAVAEGRPVTRVERSVATGEAAPRRLRRPKIILAAALVVAVAALAGVAVILSERSATTGSRHLRQAPALALPVIGRTGSSLPRFVDQAIVTRDRRKELDFSKLMGHPVVVDFFASWCGLCQADAPLLTAASTDYRNVAIIAVDFLDTSRGALSLLRKVGATYTAVQGDKATSQRWGVTAIPVAFFIDPKGRIVERVLGQLTLATLGTGLRAIGGQFSPAPKGHSF
jgi:thiol-disulfide isomerase/thioredoxin